MPKLVMTSSRLLEVGGVYRNLWDPWAVHRPKQVYRVTTLSTREEYIECIVSFGESRDWAEMISGIDPYFYEIETD